MPCFSQYDIIIFDCDGVILDSNNMKISAMHAALKTSNFPDKLVEIAVKAFMNNFGKSRYYHSQYFVEILLGLEGEKSIALQEKILLHYSQAVETHYLNVPLTDGCLSLIQSLNRQQLYVASGSEQEQLIRIFQQRELFEYFKDIFGSPETKANNVKKILQQHGTVKTLFIGDAIADFEAAFKNNIDFIFYSPYSQVKEKMLKMAKTYHFEVLNSFR